MTWGLLLNIQPQEHHSGMEWWAAETATLLDNILVQDSAKSPLLLSFSEWMQNMSSI